jgi:hypothetical protein
MSHSVNCFVNQSGYPLGVDFCWLKQLGKRFELQLDLCWPSDWASYFAFELAFQPKSTHLQKSARSNHQQRRTTTGESRVEPQAATKQL